tara:strand:+ start:3486 stop:4082 length:597 start_codon:yes stop_codon:yes gene_type:complete
MRKTKEEKDQEEMHRLNTLEDDEIRDLNHVEDLYNLIMENRWKKKPTTREAASLFKTEHIKVLLLHMGIKGKSYKSLAFVLGVSPSTLYKWEKAWPKWKEAKEMAELGRLGKIEDSLLDLGSGKTKGNAAAAIFYAKNAAPEDYKDKREIGVSGAVTYVIDTGIPARKLPGQEIPEAIEAEFKEIENEEALENDEDFL